MKLSIKMLSSSLLLVVPSIASPTGKSAPRGLINSLECLVVDLVIKDLQLIPTATPFCSSFIHIPTITTTKTATATSVVPASITQYYSTSTSTINSVSTTTTLTTSTPTTTSTVSTTVTVTGPCNALSTPTAAAALAERDRLPSALGSFASSQISTACRCLGIPTPTETCTTSTTVVSTSTSIISAVATAFTTKVISTNTITITSIAPTAYTATTTTTITATVTPAICSAPPSCGNTGLQFAVYSNTNGRNDATGYPNFSPEGIKTVQPEYQGTITTIGGFAFPYPQPATANIYGQYTRSVEFFELNHRGYIYAPQTGSYSFQMNINGAYVDDISLLWVGDAAYSGWTRANDNLQAEYSSGRSTVTFKASFVAGKYYPFRVVYANAQRGASFTFQVTAPDGTVLLGSNAGSSGYIVQYSCDAVTAPRFSPFGSET